MAYQQVSNPRHANGKNQTAQTGRQAASQPAAASEQGMMSGLADQASEYWAQGREQMEECVRGREAMAVVMAAAAGLGVGLVLGASLGRFHRQQLTWRDRITAEGFGRRLIERLESMILDALPDHY